MKRTTFLIVLAAALVGGGPDSARAGSFDLTGLLGEAANFTVLGLENGQVTINSSTSIVGDVGYTAGVTSNTNQKVDDFTGSAFVHSTATFNHTPDTFAPSGGIQTGPAVDAKLDSAHADAVAASSFLTNLSSLTESAIETSLGVDGAQKIDLDVVGDGDNFTFDTTGVTDVSVFDVSSWIYKEDTLSLVGDAEDVFIFNVSGDFNWDSSDVLLTGVSVDNVIFNFEDDGTANSINVGKASTDFNGRILAPDGSVDYHNPATFNGAILAFDVTLHSDFNLSGPAGGEPPVTVPEPSTLLLLAGGFAALAPFARRRRGAG